MSDEVAIKVDNVSKAFKLPHEKTTSIKSAVVNFYKRKRTFEHQEAVKNVSFEVKKGDFFAIVGRNGSGKSTLLKMLAGIYTPSKGSVQVNGKLTPFIELGVGFSPELTGRENVYLNGALLGFSRKEMDAMYDDIVAFAELERFMDQKLKNYSSGMQVRLAFSIAIRARSDILLLDEVLAVGDAAFQQKCYDYFEQLKQDKRTVVFVSHDMGAVKRFCTRAVYIKDSKLIKEGTPLEVADIYIEENLKSTQENAKRNGDDINLSSKHKLQAKILNQDEHSLELIIDYEAQDDQSMYAGISIIKDGVSVGELNTMKGRPLVRKGSVRYTLDTRILNDGVYFLDAALFQVENRKLLASIYKRRPQFLIKGDDVTRSAAIKLADTWEYH